MTGFIGIVAIIAIAWIWSAPRVELARQKGPATSQHEVGLRVHQDSAQRKQRARALMRWASAWGPRRGRAQDQGALVGGILVAVAARLRAGQSPGEAWRASLEDKPDEVVRALHSVVPEAGGGAAGGQVRGLDIAARTAIASAGAATDVARTLGAELAGVLQACAEGIEEAARATADRVAALSGPRSTARLLMGLPLAGVILGVVMGAKPLGFLTGTWWGALVLAMALMLTIIGHWWIRRLIDSAALTERAGVSLRER